VEPDDPPLLPPEPLPLPPAGALGVVLGVVLAVDSLFDSLFVEEVLAPSDLLSPPPFLGVDEYRSAYQPPPFRMKFPPEIWRFAVLLLHLGQTSRASAEIF